MSYTKLTDYAAKDALLTGDPNKKIKGTELGAEFDAIVTADAQNVKLTEVQTLTQKTLTSPVINTGDINTPDIDGGTVDGAIIGGATPAAITGTTITGNTSVSTPALTATSSVNFAGATVSNLGTVTTADINGGTIDGTVIGGASAAAITGTTITASTSFAGALNGTVGATTPAAGTFTTITSTGNVTVGDAATDILTVQAGSASAPAIVPSGDTNTGVWFPAADTVAVSTAGSERVRIDSAGGMGIGIVPYNNTTVSIGKGITGSTTSYGTLSEGQIKSGVTTSAYYFATNANTEATSFTLGALRHYSAYQGTIGATSSVTNQYGFIAESSLTGATNNYGFYSNIASGTGRWNFYAAGTASNYFGGLIDISASTAGQIKFPATQNASADANTLDDYEEGVFSGTPTASSGTFTSASYSGTYTKIGRLVTIRCGVTITTNGSAAGSVIVVIPFTTNGTAEGTGRGFVSGKQLQALMANAATTIAIVNYDNTYPGATGESLTFTASYFV